MIWMLVALNTYTPLARFPSAQECEFMKTSINLQVNSRVSMEKQPGLACIQVDRPTLPRKGSVL